MTSGQGHCLSDIAASWEKWRLWGVEKIFDIWQEFFGLGGAEPLGFTIFYLLSTISGWNCWIFLAMEGLDGGMNR
jgi:hypothetical protein